MTEPDLQAIRHYYRYDASLASAGQPEAAQFEPLSAAFDCVINLARFDSPHAVPEEADILRTLELTYIHQPVDFKQPQAEDIDDFLALTQQHCDERLFVHCAYNWRASSFVFLHRVINLGCDTEQALSDLHAIWQPDATWQHFIDTTLQRYNVPTD